RLVGSEMCIRDRLGTAPSFVDLAMLQGMHQMKTGALIQASVQLGICCREASALDPAVNGLLNQFAAHLGLAFQVIDDVLDDSSSTSALGKTAGKDKAQHKPTYVSLMGLAQAQALALDLHRQAIACLAEAGKLDSNLRAEGMGHLTALADLIVLRQH
ncbi:MAG: hypothetical protein EBX90_08675, partial [Betaproteobacteria bacterium]|nr:hypothetical protein [Betaproteobacteria bacterium]